MSKELDALENLYIAGDLRFDYVTSKKHKEDYNVVEKALKVIELLKTRGISLVIPNNEFSNEHIDIQVFTKTLTKEELEMIKEVIGLWA